MVLKPPRFRFSSIPLLSLALALLLCSCTTVPVTGRKSLRMVPSSQLTSMSLQEYSSVLKKSKLSQDTAKVEMVRRVGANIARSAEAFLRDEGRESQVKDYQWEFNLIEEDKTINAWCMPGGKVAVYTGILPVTQSETGLAIVMGHEVAHALADHGNERMSQGLLATMGGVALSVAMADKPKQTQDLFMAAFGVGTGVGILLPYSRMHESEADRIGLMLSARAGYDPQEAVPFWKRMNEKGKSGTPEFLSTHPAPESRIENIEKYLPEAMQYYKSSKK